MRVRAAIAAAVAFAFAVSAAGAAVRDARVVGTFAMRGVVTVAVNVRGEHRGQQVYRRWMINALGCQGGDDCNRLLLTRDRGRVQSSFVVLHRIAPGEYRGYGAFWVPLECLGLRFSLGSRAPYEITLHVGARRQIGNIRYATTIRATYTNRARSDDTRCPLGPSYDAASYLGRLTSQLPEA